MTSLLLAALAIHPLALSQGTVTPPGTQPEARPTDQPQTQPTVASGRPTFPSETEADRRPKLRTGGDVLIRNGRLLTVTRGIIERGDILVRGGKIAAIGPNLIAPAGVTVYDAAGKVVSPGIVDTHIHRGFDSTNEGSDSIVAEGRVLDVLNPDLKNVWQAVASGETTGMLLHGSANPVGAESLVIKLKYGRTPDELPVPGAPRMIKWALGENVTRSGSSTPSQRYPRTRPGVETVFRRAFAQARTYRDAQNAHAKDPSKPLPRKDLRLETLADILDRKVWVQCHGYRADEHLMLVRLSQELGFKIGALQHAVESYKIAPELAAAGVGVSIFDEWAVKLELYDGISAYAAAVHKAAGVLTSFHTDGTSGTTALNINAAKAMRCGGLTENEALRLITLNGAKELGIDNKVGSLDVGKDADIVVWDGHPLSVYSRVRATFIEGECYFERRDAHNVDGASVLKTKLDPFTYAPNPPVPPYAAEGLYAIVGATVYPVGRTPIPNGTVVLRRGRIVAVGGSTTAIPAGAVRVAGQGLRVYPGFIDAGTTVGLTEFGQVGQATDAREIGAFQPDLIAATGVNVQSENIPVARVQGITTVLTAPAGGTVGGYASVLNLLGGSSEELTLSRRAGLAVNWSTGGGSRAGEHDHENAHGDGHDNDLAGGATLQAAAQAGSEALNAFFDRAAKYKSGTDAPDPILEAMGPVLRREVPMFVRVRAAAGIRDAVAFAKARNVRIVLVGAADAWKETDLLRRENVPVIIEAAGRVLLGANAPVSEYDPYDTPYVLPALLRRGGVKFAFMTDSYADVMNLPHRAAESCAYGLAPDAMLRALTLDAAEILGVGTEIGSIAPGKRGNLVISDGDPFEQTSNIRYLFINGQPVPLVSKHTRLRDQYLARIRR